MIDRRGITEPMVRRPGEDDGVFFMRQAVALLVRLHLRSDRPEPRYRWRLSSDVLAKLRSLEAPRPVSIDTPPPDQRLIFGYPYDVDAAAPPGTLAMRNRLGEEASYRREPDTEDHP